MINNETETKLKILFLCTGNSCRSQIAEGWANHLKSDIIEAYSAGIAPRGLDERAVKVMHEVGVDISKNESKDVSESLDMSFDYVITVCGHADENCPVFPGQVKKIHHGFDDPPRLAESAKTEEEALMHYRLVRDEIRDYVESFPRSLDRQA